LGHLWPDPQRLDLEALSWLISFFGCIGRAGIAIVTKVRKYQRHSRENGNPWVARLSRWIPAYAGMTGNCLMDHGYSYKYLVQ